jgi:hypothetical protein
MRAVSPNNPKITIGFIIPTRQRGFLGTKREAWTDRAKSNARQVKTDVAEPRAGTLGGQLVTSLTAMIAPAESGEN